MAVATEILKKRALAVRALLTQYRLDAILFMRPASVRYLSSLEATSAAVLITRRSSFLYTDFRYLEEATSAARGFRVKVVGGSLAAFLGRELLNRGIGRLGFESNAISYSSYRMLKRRLGGGAVLVPLARELAGMRAVKDPGEVRRIREAAKIAVAALDYFREVAGEGMTEREVAALLDARMREMGAERSAFDTIVASGRRTSMPHAKASSKRLKRGEPILVDLGAVVGGYHSDLTRTFFLSRIQPRFKAVYERVLEAQMAAIASLRGGAVAAKVDGTAREIISREPKVGDFGHSLGHGIGLEVHEEPVLSPASRDVLHPGTVCTVEPGIYRKGSFGIRIEDMVMVTKTGHRLLTEYPKSIDEAVL